MTTKEQDAPASVESNGTAPQDAVEKVAKKGLVGNATVAQLKAKPKRVLHFEINLVDAEGEDVTLAMKYQAISPRAYDKLVSDHPPKPKEKALGAQYDADTFGPALISAVSVIPELTVDDAAEIYHSEDWSAGEVMTLFMNALKVCNQGLDVPFSDRG